MDKKINLYLGNGSMADYDELDHILKTATFKTVRIEDNSNPNRMGIDWALLAVMLPVVYPYIVEFRKTLISYFSYKQSQSKEFSITLENDGKKLEMSVKNVDIPSIDEFMTFYNSSESEEDL